MPRRHDYEAERQHMTSFCAYCSCHKPERVMVERKGKRPMCASCYARLKKHLESDEAPAGLSSPLDHLTVGNVRKSKDTQAKKRYASGQSGEYFSRLESSK